MLRRMLYAECCIVASLHAVRWHTHRMLEDGLVAALDRLNEAFHPTSTPSSAACPAAKLSSLLWPYGTRGLPACLPACLPLSHLNRRALNRFLLGPRDRRKPCATARVKHFA
jgi:hypothetical protein